jgi:hypothetical protein
MVGSFTGDMFGSFTGMYLSITARLRPRSILSEKKGQQSDRSKPGLVHNTTNLGDVL